MSCIRQRPLCAYSNGIQQPPSCRPTGGPDGFDPHGSSTPHLTYVAAGTQPSTFKSRDTQEGASLESLSHQQYESHVKCPLYMLGKAHLKDFPPRSNTKVPPLYQIDVDLFSSSVESIEGFFDAVVFVDKHRGYLWMYGMKRKDEMFKVAQKWYSYIA